MAKNHFWKQFENRCARDFGGAGRFPANQGGALDFETAGAIGQCKTMSLSSKKASYSIKDVHGWAKSIYGLGRGDKARREKMPVVCVKVRRGAGVRSEALFCLTYAAAVQWIGKASGLYGVYDVAARGLSLNALTEAVETLGREEPDTIGLRVTGAHVDFVAMGRTRFLQSYEFAKGKA